ncbi:MAG: hypothetical protein N3A68_03900 [Bacteroidia bacterium]|jgi:hypothetical protein|nr:hypothetical protein [Bacteroidia bacterium]
MKQGGWRLAKLAGVGVCVLWFIACSLQKDSSSSTASDEKHSGSIVESLADSIEQATTNSSSAPVPQEHKRTSSTGPLPPPKKEPWMDTLVDLTNIPPPNSAVLLEEDPIPQNKRTVELLIAKQYHPKRPIQLTLRMYVTEEGKPRRFQILKNSDPKLTLPYLAYPIVELRFVPALYNGKPVAAWTTLTLQIQPEK